MMGKKYNILYVDDEPDNLLAFRSVFRRFFNIFTANGAKEAIELVKQHDIDLILSDQRMPNMTGVELLERIMDDYPQIQRFIVTGYSEMKPIINAVNTGKVSKYIMKPWNVEELKQTLEQALDTAA